MTSRFVTFDIRVYPLVRKFLAYHYPSAPFEVSNIQNPCASYLYACLDRYDHRDTQQPQKYARMSETLTISVAGWRIKAYGTVALSPTKQAAFNNFVKQLFFEKLASEVGIHTSLGKGLKASIQTVLDRYDISEKELSIYVAMRYYYRYQRKMRLEYCHLQPAGQAVTLSHERDRADRQTESGWRAMA